jgi:hypothetical protein
MKIKIIITKLALTGVLFLAGCSERPAEEPVANAPPASAADTVLPRSPSPQGASVFFVTPSDGGTVSSPLRVEFGIEGMQVVAAGVDAADSGHHHLLVDTGLPDLRLPIPKDDRHIHFGDGSTATELDLAPGEHTLQLLLGDHLHIPHEPPVMSAAITIIVE